MTPIDERFSRALHNCARAWRQAVDRRLKDLGVGQAGWLAIATVAKSAEPLSQTELAHRLGIEDATMVSMIDRLMKAGLVSRRPSETDRRVKHVILTKAGDQIFKKVKTEADAFRRELLKGVPRDKLMQATELLEALQAAAESLA